MRSLHTACFGTAPASQQGQLESHISALVPAVTSGAPPRLSRPECRAVRKTTSLPDVCESLEDQSLFPSFVSAIEMPFQSFQDSPSIICLTSSFISSSE